MAKAVDNEAGGPAMAPAPVGSAVVATGRPVPAVVSLQEELAATKQQLDELRVLVASLAERTRPQMPGIPIAAPPLDAAAVVRQMITDIDAITAEKTAALEAGPRKFKIVQMIGDKVQRTMERTVGAGSEGEADWKYRQFFGITSMGPPARLVITPLEATPAAA